jgi:hypothetical protein
VIADDGVALAGLVELAGEGGNRLREHEGFTAQLDAYLIASGVHVVEGELADRRWPLGVEQDEHAGEPGPRA